MPSRTRIVVATIIIVILSLALVLHLNLTEASPFAKVLGTSATEYLGSDAQSTSEDFKEEAWGTPPMSEIPAGNHDFLCPSNIDWLNDLHLDYPIRYARRDIIVKPTVGLERASVTKIKEPLFPDFQEISDPAVSNNNAKHCKKPLVLEVPSITENYADASHVIFGISTSLQRLEDSIPYFQRWLAHTKGRLIVQVVGPDESSPDAKEMRRLGEMMNNLGICVTIVKPLRRKDSMAERYFSLVKLMYEHRDKSTRWISLFDDDTFVTSMPLLLDMLAEHDSEKQQYVGAMSEEWWTVGRYGMMGFGGAGVFLSIPLAKVLDENFKSCRDRSGSSAGDIRIFECIKWHTNTKLTHVSGLHQIDLHGDRSGLFESGRQLLTVHHWKESWWDQGGMRLADSKPMDWYPMASMHLVASVCDNCFLQRWQFGNDMILSNGYSIATYPTGKLGKFEKDFGLEKVEQTWTTPAVIEGSHNEGFDHYLGPLRPKLELEKDKIQYIFLDAVAVDGGVRQWYLHKVEDGGMNELVELFWTRQQQTELKNP